MPDERVSEPTLASTWHVASGGAITDELLEWPQDLFALTNVILARSEAFRCRRQADVGSAARRRRAGFAR